MTVPEFVGKLESSDFETPHHRDATLAIVRSDLGQQFLHFMFDSGDPISINKKLEELTKRTFKKGGKSITAQSALYLLVAQINKMGSLGTETLQRLQLFQNAMMEKQATGAVNLGKHITVITALIALIATSVGIYEGSAASIVQNFFKFLGPASWVYFFWFDQVQKARGASVVDEIRSRNDKSWQAFLSELEKL